MSLRRLAVASAVLLLVAAAAWQLTHPDLQDRQATGAHQVGVTGPAGEPLLAGSFVQANATPLSLLLEAAALANVTVESVEYPGYGGEGCPGTYVWSIAGIAPRGSSGWVYEVRPSGGRWQVESIGAACRFLAPGEDVRWLWTKSAV